MTEAVEALKRAGFDVVLVNEVLPDGRLLEAAVVTEPRPQRPSFVYMPGFFDLEVVDDSGRFPPNRRVVMKPFTWRQALPALQEALRSRRRSAPKR